MFISILLCVGMFNAFTISYKLEGVNKAIIYAPIEIFEYAIPITSFEHNGSILTFDTNKVKEKYKEYLDSVIYQYIDSYDLSFSFYTIQTEMITEKYEGVDITFKTKISFVDYERVMFYEISEGING